MNKKKKKNCLCTSLRFARQINAVLKILSMKIRANNIDLIDAKRFDSFSSVIFNCKNKYCCLCNYMATKNRKIVM